MVAIQPCIIKSQSEKDGFRKMAHISLRIRRALNLTQKELGKQIHVSSQLISHWERGTRPMCGQSLKSFADIASQLARQKQAELNQLLIDIDDNLYNT